jgi:DNA ligase (NAD+)
MDLEEKITYYSNKYYNGEAEISDKEFDALVDELRKTNPESPVLSKVGAPSTGYGKKIKLDPPIGSLTEIKEDWEKWVNDTKNVTFIVSTKLDGVSAVLWYEDGKLVQAASRGDGHTGSDILRHLQYVPTVPKYVKYQFTGQVRGEIICPKKEIPVMLEQLKRETGKAYKNGRNTVAGYLNSKTGAAAIARHIQFVAYSFPLEEKMTEWQRFTYLYVLGFQTPWYDQIKKIGLSFEKLTQIVKHVKEQDKYEADGIVITANQWLTSELETGSINPCRSRKFKLGAVDNFANTEVLDIEWNISKDGYLKPIIKIKPVDIQGVTISNVTGNNYRFVTENHLGIGAQIKIIRAGDVIPQVAEILTKSDQIPYPKVNYELTKNGVDAIYLNGDLSLEREIVVKNVVYFLQSLGIDQGGTGNVNLLSTEDSVPAIQDLLSYDRSHFVELIGKNGEKLYNSLHEKVRSASPAKFYDAIQCFGRGIGERKLQKVWDKYETFDVTEDQLRSVDGFADKTIIQYLSHVNTYLKWEGILKNLGIVLQVQRVVVLSNKLNGQGFCFTGVRSKDLEARIQRQGGKICSGITSECTCLIVKSLDSGSSKTKKAQEKGIKIITLEEANEIY